MKTYQAKIYVSIIESVLDPQGKTVLKLLQSNCFSSVKDLRVGKFFQLQIESESYKNASILVHSICTEYLVNPIVEEYSFILEEV